MIITRVQVIEEHFTRVQIVIYLNGYNLALYCTLQPYKVLSEFMQNFLRCRVVSCKNMTEFMLQYISQKCNVIMVLYVNKRVLIHMHLADISFLFWDVNNPAQCYHQTRYH